MNSKIQTVKSIFAAGAMLALILDAETALLGCAAGLELCIRSVIPALFPFLVCSGYLTGNLGSMSLPLLRPLGRLCRIPDGSEGILLIGLVGGYPVGAQAITQAWEAGDLSTENARRMLGFCNNAGPAFLFGMLSGYFNDWFTLWLLWGIQIISAVIAGWMLPGDALRQKSRIKAHGITLPQALHRAVRTMAVICGWVILFRTILMFMEQMLLWLLPNPIRVFVSGILELTNGCVSLSSVENEGIRFLMASLFLSSGGLCVGMQTISVCGNLGTGFYFPGKILQTGICALICGLTLPVFDSDRSIPWLIPAALLMILLSLYSISMLKNNSSNFRMQGV